MPAAQLAQKQVGVVPRIVDVVQDGRAADFAGVIDYYSPKPRIRCGIDAETVTS